MLLQADTDVQNIWLDMLLVENVDPIQVPNSTVCHVLQQSKCLEIFFTCMS